jgi:hypothetical protein
LSRGGRKSTPGTLDRVIGGRIKKFDSPKPSPADSSYLEEGNSRLDDVEREMEADRFEDMREEKKLFPGSDEWAPDEERLFQTLFMRQYSPLMPPYWSADFRGIPLPDILFATSEVDRPIVYSYSDRDFWGKNPLAPGALYESLHTGVLTMTLLSCNSGQSNHPIDRPNG